MSFLLRALLLCCLVLYCHHVEALFSFHTKRHRFAKRTLQAQRRCYQRTTQTTTGSGTSQHGSIVPDPTTANITGNLTNPTPEEYTSIHNKYRALHGAQNLIWNDTLSAKAQQWANGCVFQHSHGSLGPFGENLAAGTGSAYDFSSAFKSWTDDEEGSFDPAHPVASHFTQVVWKSTKQVGCALTEGCAGIFDPKFGNARYYVCEYFPPGNFDNEFSDNVQP